MDHREGSDHFTDDLAVSRARVPIAPQRSDAMTKMMLSCRTNAVDCGEHRVLHRSEPVVSCTYALHSRQARFEVDLGAVRHSAIAKRKCWPPQVRSSWSSMHVQ